MNGILERRVRARDVAAGYLQRESAFDSAKGQDAVAVPGLLKRPPNQPAVMPRNARCCLSSAPARDAQRGNHGRAILVCDNG